MVDIKKLLKSKVFKWVIIGIGILIAVLLILQVGMFVGYKKAAFSYKWGEDYYRAFGPGQGRMPPRNDGRIPMMRGQFPESYGVSGKILKIDLPIIIIDGKDGVEKAVLLKDGIDIRRFKETVKSSDLKIDDIVVVIGSPNSDSQIEAKLIRILPAKPAEQPAQRPPQR